MGFNLTGTQVKNTYQKLAQISGSVLTNGTGSVITNLNVIASNATNATNAVNATFAISASYAAYAVSASHEIIKEVSSSYADTAGVADSVAYTNITGKPTLVSGSAQIVIGSTIGNLSGSRVIGAVAGTVAYGNVTGKPTLISGSAQIVDLGFATTGSNTFIGNQAIQGNVTFVSSSFISSNNQSGSIYISALNGGTVYLNSDGGEGDVNVGYNGWGGKLNVEGNVTIEDTLTVTNIEGTGSLFLKPDKFDSGSREFVIYNTNPQDIHQATNAAYAFFGDDDNYLKIDNPAGQVSIDATNRIFLDTNTTVIGDLNVSGTLYPNQISFFSSSIAQTTGSYVLTTSALGVVQYDTYANIAKAVQGNIQINSVAGDLSGSRVVGALGGTLPWANITDKGGVATTGSNSFTGNQTINGDLNVTGPITGSKLLVNGVSRINGTLRVTNDAQFDTHILIQGAAPHLKLRDTSGGGFSSGYDIIINTGSFEIYDDTHNRDVLSDRFNPATSKHTTELTSEIIIISGSTSVTLQGNVTGSSIKATSGFIGNLTGTATTASFVTEAAVAKTTQTNVFGSTQFFTSNVVVTGSVTANGGFVGNATTATSASFAGQANGALFANQATSASYVAGQENYARKDQANTFTQRNAFSSGINLTGSLAFNNTNDYEGIDLFQGVYPSGAYSTPIRFYSGSRKDPVFGNNRWINLQTAPGNIAELTFSSFPENDHFLFLQPAYCSPTGVSRTAFEKSIGGYYGDMFIDTDTQLTGSLKIKSPVPLSNTTVGMLNQSGSRFTNVAPFTTSTQNFLNSRFGLANQVSRGTPYRNAFAIENWNNSAYDNTTFGSGLYANGRQITLELMPSGSAVPNFTSGKSQIVLSQGTAGTTSVGINASVISIAANPSVATTGVGIGNASLATLTMTAISGSFNGVTNSRFNNVRVNGALNVTGNTTITGQLAVGNKTTFNDQVVGSVLPLTIGGGTATLDCSAGNFFTITLAAGTDTVLTPTNIHAGQTINLQITQNGTTAGTISFASTIKFTDGIDYVATTSLNAVDVISLVSFDGTNLLATAVKNLQ